MGAGQKHVYGNLYNWLYSSIHSDCSHFFGDFLTSKAASFLVIAVNILTIHDLGHWSLKVFLNCFSKYFQGENIGTWVVIKFHTGFETGF
jgi:hypothetical protein